MSDGRKYYCFCDANCRFETMTKEQILAAIAEAAAGGLVFDSEAAFITKVKENNAGGFVTFWVGTAAQYNALAEKDPACFYMLTDVAPYAETAQTVQGLLKHAENKDNPHGVTAEQAGAAPAEESAEYAGCYYRIVDDVTEWVNPPLVVGVEYRTTERYNSKAVYSKVVDFGYLPKNTSKTVAHGITDATFFVSVRSIAARNGYYLEYVTGQGDAVSIAGADIKIATAWSAGDYTAYVFLKYVKD